jgi:glutamate carboxypeptidase
MDNQIIKDLLTFLDTHREEQLKFLVDICNQNSYTFFKDGTDRVSDLIYPQIIDLLPHHQSITQKKIGNFHRFTNSPDKKAIYLVGHLDTVFPADFPFQKCKHQGNILYGPGTADMKGGLAIIVYTLKVLAFLQILNRLNVTLILNSDEEIGSVYSKDFILNETKNAEICLVAECAGPKGEIVVSRNGKLGARIDSWGEGRHIGHGTQEKSSAIVELAQKVLAMESLNGSLSGVSLNVGKIEGGLGPSTVPSHAYCLLDVRWIEQKHRKILLEKINKFMSNSSQPNCWSEFNVLNSRPAMPVTPGNEHLFKIVQDVGKDLDKVIRQEHRRGTSDANFFSSASVPTLDGFGPEGGNDHTPEEFIKISTLKERTALLTLFLMRYLEEKERI